MSTTKQSSLLMRMLYGIVRFYCVFVILWFLSYWFFQDSHWVLVALDKFAEYFLAVSVPVFFVALLSRRFNLISLAIAPLMITGFFYLPLFVPDEFKAEVVDDGTGFRVMTYNIWNHNKDLDSVASVIVNANPDVVAIQELTEEQKPGFLERIAADYPYYHISRAVYGGTTGLLSKTPIGNVKELEFNIDRPAIFADIQKAGKTVTVVSAHLNPSFWAYYQKEWHEIPALYHQYIKDQNAQAQMILDTAKKREHASAVFLACDCNSQETASTNRILRSYFSESLDIVGWQTGEPTVDAFEYERDISHIDYVWFSGRAKLAALYRARESAGSDHKPVVADFVLQ